MSDWSNSTGLSSPTRRDILKRGAAGGALLWSAPAILTIARAGAQSSPCPGCTSSAFGLRLNATTLGEGGCEAAETVGPVTANVICGQTGTGCSANASIADVTIVSDEVVGTVTAVSSSAEVACDCATGGSGPSGTATLAGLSLLVGDIPLEESGPLPCNQVLIDALGVKIVLNEQTCDGGVLTVNAVHIIAPVLGDLILAQSQADVAGCTCATCA